MKPSSRSFSSCVRIGVGLLAAAAIGSSLSLADLSAQAPGQVPVPIPGRNINMVSGTTLPGGDPFLQRQNEPTVAVSTRNPLHILGAANDYRTVDIPGLGEEVIGDAWIGIFKSFDGGSTWKSSLLPGFRQDVSPEGLASPLYGLEAGADPVIRAGTHGLFYMAGMAFNRDQDAGRVFVARYIDNNNLEAGDSIAYLNTSIVDIGTADRFLDKPWITVDIPRAMKGRGRNDKDDKDDRAKYKDKKDPNFKKQDNSKNTGIPRRPISGPVCAVPGQAQPIPAGMIYVVYSAFITPQVQQQAADPNRPKTARERELEREEKMFGKKKNREEWEEKRPGQPIEGRTKIMLARSDDCGATFSRPQQISERTQINQGAVMAIDPNTGDLYVAWREFMSSTQPDRILVTKSSDFGRNFSSPVAVAQITPFDQGTTATSFRTNSYPAMTVDGTGRVYIAWAQRGVGPGADARIVITSSPNGKNWPAPVPADNHAGRGHQIMPVLNFGGGKLHLVFWDQRDDVSRMWGEFIDEFPIVNWTGDPRLRPKRHTLDLRAVSAWPGAPPTWGPSVRVSNYLEGVLPGSTQPVQLQFNAPNLPLFGLGTKPFIGDYLDVTMAPSFIANGDGTWRFNTQLSDPTQFFTSWGDNRDVRPPRDGNWVHYTPPTFAGYTGTSIYDPTQPVEICSAGQAGMRDQNVYSARVSSGLIVSTPGNNKPLGFVTGIDGVRRLIQRSFVVTVTNTEDVTKSVTLHITAQPPGGVASFLQFEPLFDLPVDIAAKSSISREVYVTSTDVRATVPVTVTEGTSGAASARLFFNPDPTNPDIDNPDIDNPDIDNPDIDNAEAHNITVSNPTVFNPDIDNIARANPDIDNPDIDNPDIDNSLLANLAILNPDIDNPDIDNPDIDNVDIVNPDIDNPDIDNPDIDNAALTDVTWNVSNVGNTATAYQVKLLLKQAQQQRLVNAGVKFQLVITKTTAAPSIDRCAVVEPNRNLTIVTINSPSFVDPSNAQQVSTVINPDIDNPDIDNATMALAPGDTARVTLRVYSPIGDTTVDDGTGVPAADPLDDLAGALADLQNVGVATSAHAVDTNDVIAGETTPQIAASIPFIITNRLDDATRGQAYFDQIEQTGSAPPFSFALVTGSLPLGLTLNADGTITGTPQVAGSSTFTVRLTDANEGTASATLTIRVFEPVQVVPGELPGANINQPYTTSLAAFGGFSPFGWSLASGALPAGVTLTPAGSLAGTPTQSGSFNFVAMAMDTADPAKAGSGAFSLSVTAAPNAQSVNVVEETATPITVSATGSGPFTFAIGNQPAHGTLSGTGPIFTYTPDLNYTGTDSFTFSATQGGVTSSFATVSITVTPVNDAPIATPNTVNAPQGVAIPIVLTGTDPENNPLTFSIFSAPTAGTLSGTAPNVTYTPPAGFTGTATFQFRANDGVVFSTPGTVSVIVGPPPPGAADVRLTLVDSPDPVALGGVVTYTATIGNFGPATATGVAFTMSYPNADLVVQTVTPSQGSCVSGVSISCAIGSVVNGGTATVSVAMRAFNRGGTFNVTSTVTSTPLDYNTTNNAATQSTVVSGPATPTADLQVSQTRLPNPVDFGSNVVYTIVVTNNGPSDATGVSLTNTFTSNTAQFVGSTTTQGPCATTPGRLTCGVGDLLGGASATITLTLRANGGGSLSNTAVVAGSQADPNAANNSNTLATTINNRTPVATNDSATTNEDVSGTLMVLLNDTDADNDTLTVTSVGTAAHGTTQVLGSNSLQYSPAANYFGPDSFTYQISDGHGGTASATVNVTVLAINDAPSFTAGANQVGGQNSGAHTVPGWASAISAGPANEAGQAITFVVSNDDHSLFSVQPAVSPAGTLTFTPAAAGVGVANVTITAVDSGGTDNGGLDASASQSFTITIDDTETPSFVVTNTNDQGPGSLRAAMATANATPGADTITFAIPDPPLTIQPQSPLPAITDGVTIDATTQPGFGTTPIVEINGSNAGVSDGLTVVANDTTIRGLVVNGFSGHGIVVRSLNSVIAGNYIGTDLSGLAADGNGGSGVLVDQSASVTIGGDGPADRNVISGNIGHGVHLNFCSTENTCNGSVVAHNYIGTDATGAAAIANSLNGVHVSFVPNNVIRDNVISGNGDADQPAFGNGIAILGPTLVEDPDAELHFGNQTIIRNRIGTDAGGAIAIPNRGHGIALTGAVETHIGGIPSEGNTISFNLQNGVALGVQQPTPNTIVQHNTITSNNGIGVQALLGDRNWISRNTLHSNGGLGIDLAPGANNNQNAPIVTSAITSAGSTLINGTLSGAPSTVFTIELYSNAVADPSGSGEGQLFLGSVQTTSNTDGNAGFGLSTGLLAPGTIVSATAADQFGNTSEFAANILVTAPPDPNNAPSFTAGPNQSVLEDGGAQSVPNWATSISAGPPPESAQMLDFIVSNDNNALFSGQPAIAANGTLTFTPAANANGSATVTVQLHDNGGTANGGFDTSQPQTFSITVTPVNDAPGFSLSSGLYQVAFGAGAQTVPAWATGITAGPANEASQQVTFLVTSDNATAFVVQPTISPTGTLTFTLASTEASPTTVTVRAQDNAGILNSGVDTSAPQNFTISVTTPDSADLQVTIVESGDPVAPGAVYSYTATVTNNGPATATGVLFTLNVSANVTVHSIVGPGLCEQTGVGQSTCGTGTIASGASVLYFITTSATLGTATATASVSSSISDPNPTNNSAQASTTINRPPTGVADNGGTLSGVSVFVAVLSNDTDPDTALGDVLHISAIGGATNGIVSTSTGSPLVRYTPNPGFTGLDTFTYRVADAAGTESATTTVTMLVAPAICAAEPSDLISWWPGQLDVTATDLRGGNPGTPQGTVQTTSGMVGTAFSFDRSVGSGILVPHAANLNPTNNQVTMAAWVRPAAVVEDYQAIVRKTDSYSLGLTNNAFAYCEIGSAPPLFGGSVQAGQWSHVACVYDGASTTLYVDGVQVAFTVNELGIPLNANALMIGGDAISVNNEFNGLIDEVQIFNRALPIEDILTIVTTGDAGVCQAEPAVVTDDSFVVTSDTSATINPSSNDRDTGVAFPSVLAAVRGLPLGTPQLWSPGDIGIVNSTGLAYFSGGLVATAASGAIAVLDTNTNTIVGTMPMPVPSAQTLARVNQATNIVYLRGTTLNAVDGRPGSATFNQVILSLALGNIQSMALDETRGRLYLTANTNATSGSFFNSRFIVIDVNPASATFHQVVDQIAAPGGGNALSVVVNTVTNRIYVAVSGGTASGVYALDVATNTWTLIPTTTNPSTLLVNDATNLIYGVTGTSLYVIDGATNTRLALVTLPASGSTGTLDTRLAVHRPSGHVYVRLFEFPGTSRLAVIDGIRLSPTFNTILTTLPIGREDGVAMVAVDEINNRVITTSRSDLRTTVINATTNAIIGTTQSTQPDLRVALDPAHHRAYIIGGITTIRSIDVTAGTLEAVLQVASDISVPAVNTQNHTAYVPQTTTGAGVALINQAGLAGAVTLPHVDGRESIAVRNRVTNRIYSLNTSATVAGGSDGLPGFVHVIDGATNNLLASVPAGAYPFGLAVNEATNKIYVGNSFSGSVFSGGITVIDGATNSPVQADMSQIPTTSATPGQITVARDMIANPTTGKLYFRVTNGSSVTLGVLNGTTNVATPLADDNEVIGIVRVNPVLNKVYIGAQETAADPTVVYILDGANEDFLAAVQVGSPTPFIGTQSYLAVNVTTGRVFVADYDHDKVDVLDGTTDLVVASIAVGDGPSTVAVNESLNRIYVGNALDKTLTIIDGYTMRVAATLSLPLPPVRLEVDESVSQIFAMSSLIEPGVMVIDDPGTTAPAVSSVTNGASGTAVLNVDGSVTYTPNAGFSGSDTFTYQIPDGLGGFSTGTVHVTVASPLTIPTADPLPATSVGQAYPGATLTVVGGTAPYYWSVTSGQLPPGIGLNTVTGAIAGSALQSGAYTFIVQVRDSADPRRVATKSFTINVGPPVIVTTTLPSAFIGTMYNATVAVAGATGATTWAINTNNNPLLGWLSITNAGVLTGVPPAVGSMPPFTVIATDSLGQVASRSLSFFVSGPLDVEPLREGVVLESQPSLSIIGGRGTRSVSVTSGALPLGLTLASNGSFTGAPTRHGTFNFTLEIRDCSPATTCASDETPLVISKNISLRVSAKDQQGNSQTQPAISFGGPGGRRLAQVVTVGATGTLTGIGLQQLTCPAVTPLSVVVQRLTAAGLPDGTSIATGSATANYNAISVTPTVDMSIGEKFAFIVSSPVACTFVNAATTDQYNAGDAYVDPGSGWVSLLSTDGRYDLPSFRTLLQPAMAVDYLANTRGAGATATLLNNGTVLLTGTGASAEIYNPATNSTTLTGSMSSARTQHTATLLQDGTVLIVGGQTGGVRLATAETYNPATGTFSLTTGSMAVGRDVHAATRLSDGRVLITGGNRNLDTSSVTLNTAEIYDPITRTFTAAPNMTTARQVHNSILLDSGRVLVASGFISSVGGAPSRSAEIYDPVANTFTATVGQMTTARGWSAAELLADGRVLISGGQSGPPRNTAEIYDPATDSFTTTAGSMASARYQHTMTRLSDGSVLVVGGFDEVTVSNYVLALASMERYIPATNSFVPAGSTEARRARHNAISLSNGTVSLIGGAGQSFMTSNTGEFYSQAGSPALTTPAPDGQVGVLYPTTVLSASGGVGGPYQFQLVSGVLPPGLQFNAPGTISGTPTTDGLYILGIRVTDTTNQAATVQALSIRIGTAFAITTAYQLASAPLNRPYDVQLAAAGGTAPLVWSLAPASGGPPAGLSVGADGRISGTTAATASGATFSVRAIDASGRVTQKTFSISVVTPLDISTTILPEAAVKESYTFCLSSVSGVTTNTWSVIGGTMPPGVILQTNGCFNNAPTSLGVFSPQVQVTDLASPPQVVTRTFTIHVSAKDQEGGSQTQPVISFGGAGGRRLAQTVTVGANGTLTAFGFNSSTNCTTPNVLTVEVQRLNSVGLPDGTTISSGSTPASLSGIALSPLAVSIGDRFAFVLSSTNACTIANVPATSDNYQAGDGLADAGGGWVSLLSTDGRYDIPFRTMITPATEVAFMNRSRNAFGATVLNDGRVLLTSNGNPADIYDPVTRTISPTGNMITPRSNHTATLLADGTVLLAGGRDVSSAQLTTAEIYDPATGTFTPTNGLLTVPHEDATATRLNDGRVFIAGGRTVVGAQTLSIPTTEIYDPVSRTFAFAGNMLTDRHRHTAFLLGDGRVILIAGYTGGISGTPTHSAEIYDPITGIFTATTGSMTTVRGAAASARLADGRILVTGGQANEFVNTAEIYNPATDSFTLTGNMLSRRSIHTATTLADGSVLIAGGFDEVNSSSYILPLASMERYIPASGTFVPAGGLATRRAFHAAAPLQDGRVLLAGGSSQSWMSGNTVELYDPAAALALNPATLPDGVPGSAYGPVTLTATGGTGPYQITLLSGALPTGMTYTAGTLTLAGTPAANVIGSFPLGFQVTDNASHKNLQTLSLNVGALNTITNPYRLTDASVGIPYSQQLTATGPAPITWLNGPPSSLPPGLALSTTGVISGTPTTQAFYNFAVRAVDAQGRVAIKTLSINVIAPLTITTVSLQDGLAANGSYGGCVSRSGGVGAVNFALSGQIPAGMVLQSNGCFDGTFPARALREGGTFTFTVTATDSGTTPQVASRDYTIRVHADDQWPYEQPTANVPLPPTRRIAQVFTTGTPFGLSGAAVFNFGLCTPNTQITASAYPVMGTPAMPDESGAPLATTVVTTSSSGNFGTRFYFPTTLAMPQRSPIAIVASFAAGTCQGINWPTTDQYPKGVGWVDDGAGWQLSSTAIGRPDVLLGTLTVPDASLRFTPYWRGNPAAAVLGNGRVLIVGNEQPAEIFDPVTSLIAPTTGSMLRTRNEATATLMPNGNVLIVGGSYWDGTHTVTPATTEIYNPATGTFTAGAALPSGRANHRATLLTNGNVLITGGWSIDNATFNTLGVPNAWVLDAGGNLIASLATAGSRYNHTATLLGDGRVLVAGGYGLSPSPANASAEVYDPSAGANGTFFNTSSMLTWSGEHTATLLTAGPRSGQVLIAGGGATYPALRSASEFFNPATFSFAVAPSLLEPRLNGSATTLLDGRIVYAGGETDWSTHENASSIEIYDPVGNTFSSAGDMRVDRSRHVAPLISGGRVMFGFGQSPTLAAPRSVEVFDPLSLPFRITTVTLPDGNTGNAYPTTSFQTAGGGAGLVFAIVQGHLPNGMSMNQNGTISGTPTTAGRHDFSVTVTDAGSNVASRGFSITVNRIAITSTSPLPSATAGVNYSFQLAATGVGAITWSMDPGNTLPPNLTLSSSGLLSGTSSAVGGYFFNIRATDSSGQTTVKGFTQQVIP